MELPKRKPTRMSWYDYSTVGMYFITICAKDKKKLFGRIVGDGALDVPQVQLSVYGKIIEKNILSSNRIQGVQIEKYVIMPNHIHFLVSVEDSGGTSKAPSPTVAEESKGKETIRQNAIIPHVVSTFKRFCNMEAGENMFQRSYHDHVIRGQKDFEKIWSYIDDNPRRWKDDCFYTE